MTPIAVLEMKPIPALILELSKKVGMTPIAWRYPDPATIIIVFEEGPKLFFQRNGEGADSEFTPPIVPVVRERPAGQPVARTTTPAVPIIPGFNGTDLPARRVRKNK